MISCKICNSELCNVRKLSKHIRDQHKDVDIKTYYDTYLKCGDDGVCVVCKNSTKYSGLGDGYKKTCGKSCSTKLFRSNMKNDVEKYNSFVNKISNSVKKEWETKDQTDRILNMKKSLRLKYSNLSKEERKDRFGYLNKMCPEEKNLLIQKMTENGFLKWWRNATYEQKRLAWDKRNKKLIELWEKCGYELHMKQKETYAKKLNENFDVFSLTEDEQKFFFKKMDELFYG